MRNKKHRARRREFCGSGRKKKYLTREDAVASMGLLVQNTGTTNISAYKCEVCSEYHVGHIPAWKRMIFGL